MSTTIGTDMDGARMPLASLVEALEGYGVTVPHADRWRELRTATVQVEPARPEPPADLLTWTRADLEAHAREQAIFTVTTAPNFHGGPYQQAVGQFREPLNEAMRRVIRDNITAIIEGLRVPFDQAAAGLRKAVELGVKPTDDLRSLFEADKPVRTAWLATHHHARALDELLQVRQALGFAASVPPVPDMSTVSARRREDSGISWGITITRTGLTLDPYNRAAPWQRWLKLAHDLYLVDPSELAKFDWLQLTNPALSHQLQAHANRVSHEDTEPQADEPTEADELTEV